MLGYWRQVGASGLSVPADRPLGDLTAELTAMLGDPDPETRDGLAYPTLSTWIARGVYDDLLPGLGDGMAEGLGVGLGEHGTDSVFRRSYSALALARCLERADQGALVPGTTVLEWGDRVMTWLLAEQDTRGHVPGKGWAHAVAHGADALGALAESPHVAGPELGVILDVVAERLVEPSAALLTAGEPDRLAATVIRVLRRNVLSLESLEPWVARLAAVAGVAGVTTGPEDRDPYLVIGDAQAFLRALYLQLAVGLSPPRLRTDLLLVVVDALRVSNPHYLQPPTYRATT